MACFFHGLFDIYVLGTKRVVRLRMDWDIIHKATNEIIFMEYIYKVDPTRNTI